MHRLLPAALVAACLVTPAVAQDAAPAAPACTTIDVVVATLNKAHEHFVLLDPKSLVGADMVNVKGILISTFGSYIALGFVDAKGCVSAPVPVDQIAGPDGKPKLTGGGQEIGT